MISAECAFGLAMLAGVTDVAANLAAHASDGFTKRSWGALSIAMVLLTFGLLGLSVRGLDLAIAYTVLGATGIFGTAVCERILYGQRMNAIGWMGMLCVLCAMMLLQSSGH